MTILHSGEIGRFDSITSINDSDDITILRSGALFRVTAEVIAAYIVNENTTIIEIDATDSPYSVTILDDYITVDASAGNVIINLLSVVVFPLKPLNVQKNDSSSNTVTLDGFNSETINGQLTNILLDQYDNLTIVPRTSEWMIA